MKKIRVGTKIILYINFTIKFVFGNPNFYQI